MKNKNILFVLLSLTSVHMASAQDIIVKKDGSTVLSKVIEIGSTEVKYKKWSNQDGPLYTIAVSELLSINYENGEKETFDATSAQASTSQGQQQPQAKALGPDARNAELIQLYNKDYHLSEYAQEKAKNGKAADIGVLFFKVGESSVMSNEELEMSFVTCMTQHPHSDFENVNPHMRYNILLKNKTDKIIYVDLASCVRTSNLGEHRVYFTSEEVGVEQSSGGGVSVGLGAVAGALGVDGAIGAIANGVGISQGSGSSINKSYTQMRILSIPPHATMHLTDFKFFVAKKTSIGYNGKYTLAEKAEEFNYVDWLSYIRDAHCLEVTKLRIPKGTVNQGEERKYVLEESPIVYNYVITYSTVNDFSSYSTLNSTLYASKVAGLHTGTSSVALRSLWDLMWATEEGMEKYIGNYNHHTICGPVQFKK